MFTVTYISGCPSQRCLAVADFLCIEDEQLAQGFYLLGYFDNFIGADHANIVHHAVIVMG